MCGQPPKAAHAPRSDGPRRPRLARMRRSRVRARLGSACQRYKAASLLAGRGAAQPAPYSKPTRAVRDRSRGMYGTAGALGEWGRWQASRWASRCARVGTRRQSSSSPRDGHKQSGGGRPALHTQTLPSFGAARHAWRGCPITGRPVLAPRIRRDQASTPVRSSRRATAVARRANPCGRRRAARVEGRRGRRRHNKRWAGSSARR